MCGQDGLGVHVVCGYIIHDGSAVNSPREQVLGHLIESADSDDGGQGVGVRV